MPFRSWKSIFREVLTSFEEKIYSSQCKADNCYWLQVYYAEGYLFYWYIELKEKKNCITYLSKYPDPCANVVILPVVYPLVMSKFFESVNKVDSHNKSMQYGLMLKNYWVD